MNKKEGGISDIELIRYLDHCIDEELNKPVDDQDMELVEKYNAVIEKLQPDTYKPNPIVKERQLKALRDRCKNDQKNSIRVSHGFHGFKKNRIAVAAVAAVISVTSLTVVTCAVSNKTPIQLIQDFGNKIFGVNPGESVDIGDMMLIRSNGESVKYGSLEEAIKAEGLDIYYPTWLPDGARIESVYVNETADGREVLFMFDSDLFSMSIECGNQSDINLVGSDYTKNNFGGIEVYSFNFENEIFSKFDLEGNLYSIVVSDFETLEKMVNSLSKGI